MLGILRHVSKYLKYHNKGLRTPIFILSGDYKRVNAAREEQELRIMDLQEQIKRLEISITSSLAKEEELQLKITEMKK
jgi:hypothetical protein